MTDRPDVPVSRRTGPLPSFASLPLPRLRRRRHGGLTGRSLVLGVVVVLLAVVLASPLQRYLQQRDSVSAAEQQQRESSARVAELRKQLAAWNDPRYVEQQARARLQYAKPGDTVYVVLDGRTPKNASQQQAKPDDGGSSDSTWQSKAWTTLQVADGAR